MDYDLNDPWEDDKYDNDEDYPIIIHRVDVECIYCGWRSIEDLPIVDDGSTHYLSCPKCELSMLMNLAIIDYIEDD